MGNALLLIEERRGMVGDGASMTDEELMGAAEGGVFTHADSGGHLSGRDAADHPHTRGENA